MSSSMTPVEEAIERVGFGAFQLVLLVVLSLLMAADAAEMMLLSFIGPTLQCRWNLSSQQAASLTTSVFVGAFVFPFFVSFRLY